MTLGTFASCALAFAVGAILGAFLVSLSLNASTQGKEES